MSGDRHFVKRILTSKILLLFSLFILIFFSVNLVREIINRRDLNREIAKLEGQINSLTGRNSDLNSLIEYFKTNDFVEKEARTKLNLRKPGEKIIIVPEDASSSLGAGLGNLNQTVELGQPVDAAEANYLKWWHYFFKPEI